VLGGKELERLNAQKLALVAESDLNRLALQADVHNLYYAAGRLKDTLGWRGKITPLLLVLGPLAGLLFRRGAARPASWLSRAMTAAKWVSPLLSLWRGFAGGRRRAESGDPAT
jgi:hypothetical protein